MPRAPLIIAAAVGIVLLAACPARADASWSRFGCAIYSAEVTAPPHRMELLQVADPAAEQAQLAEAATISGNEAPGYVAFTFDDGPRPSTTDKILDALDRFRVPAAFFVVGRRLVGQKRTTRESVALLRRAIRSGHLIGNHTFGHENLRAVGSRPAARTIDRSSDAIADELGTEPRLFRPPYGARSAATRAHLAARGDTAVLWSIDSDDYLGDRRGTLRTRVLSDILARGGGVVLFHDTKEQTASAFSGLLADLEAENCRRLGAGETPIWPVSLHYFLRERDGQARPIPAAVERTTANYKKHLASSCQQPIDNRPAAD